MFISSDLFSRKMIKDPHQQLQDINFAPYGGEWVAIHNSQVISHGKNVKTVFYAAKKIYPQEIPHLMKVPGKEAWIFFNGSYVLLHED